jgi:nucleoside-diphosphate-sugar epimerase
MFDDETKQCPEILVIGASNQIGRHLLPLLSENGYCVHAISRNPPSNEIERVIWHKIDLTTSPLPDIQANSLIYLAGIPLLLPILSSFQQNQANSITSPKIGRIIAFSSTSRFTKQKSSSPKEQKLASDLAEAESQFCNLCESQGIVWTLFRPTMIYGCGMDKNITTIANFIRKFGFFPLVSEGKGLRQPVHTRDLASACLAVLNNKSANNRAYTLTGGETLSYRLMVSKIFIGLGMQPRFVSIPLPIFSVIMQLISLRSGWNHYSGEMARRMNQDLNFDHGDATRDFGYTPRNFEPFE